MSQKYLTYMSHTCDKESSICENEIGSFSCPCKPGFMKSESFSKCDDVDECAEKTHDCPANADCINAPGDFECNCKEQRCQNPSPRISFPSFLGRVKYSSLSPLIFVSFSGLENSETKLRNATKLSGLKQN